MTVRREMPDMRYMQSCRISPAPASCHKPLLRIARKIESGKIYYVSSERTLTTPAELHTRENSMHLAK